MPAARDTTMLKPDSHKVLMAMAELEYDPADLAEAAGVSKNIVYSMRRGFYTKPKYVGKIAKALNVCVADLVENVPLAAGRIKESED
ncbi:MAG: helix-turn-helix transcriptional regulator [Lachnospiraceae bacterium]|nr:helix-turn-helix transcriptional regulator [Lachnospiraceae bacterium]